MPSGLDPEVSRKVKASDSRAYLALDVDAGRAVYRGYWSKGSPTSDGFEYEDAPVTEKVRDILEWAFDKTEDVLIRIDWSGSYFRAARATTVPSPGDLEGEISLSRPGSQL